jgi:tetratricopeptide (TPR) repeat protein
MYTLAIILMLVSCRSVEKMVEKGQYDEAFCYSISKLQGEKHKKTKYVKALEKAFDKLNANSLKEIERLNPERRPENWPRIVNIYEVIEKRQARLEPLIPMVSEEGYVASFNMIDFDKEIKKSEDNACLHYYNSALELIEKSERTGDKKYAKDAYVELVRIEKYRARYKDSDRLIEKALTLGNTYVSFDILNELRGFDGREIEREMLTLPVSRMDDLWYDYRISGFDGGKNADFIVMIELSDIFFGPERETVNQYREEKELLVKKDKVKEVRDSTVVFIEKEVYEKVSANISEIFREKKSEMHGKIKVFDNKSKEYIRSIPINVYHDFNGYACKFTGDERALTDTSKKKLDNYCEDFPANYFLSNELTSIFKTSVMSEIKKIRYN